MAEIQHKAGLRKGEDWLTKQISGRNNFRHGYIQELVPLPALATGLFLRLPLQGVAYGNLGPYHCYSQRWKRASLSCLFSQKWQDWLSPDFPASELITVAEVWTVLIGQVWVTCPTKRNKNWDVGMTTLGNGCLVCEDNGYFIQPGVFKLMSCIWLFCELGCSVLWHLAGPCSGLWRESHDGGRFNPISLSLLAKSARLCSLVTAHYR